MNSEIQTYAGDKQSTTALVLDSEAMTSIMRMSEVMAKGASTVPKHLQGNQADCMAVVMQAMQWKMNPFVVAQKTHVSQSGVLGYEAQLVSAVASASGALISQPEFSFDGAWEKILGKVKEMKSDKGGKYYVPNWNPADEIGLSVTCKATLRGETAPREITVLLAQCYPRFSTQWATDPQQQITYAAVRKFCRRYAPGAILGVYTPDELQEIDVTPQQQNGQNSDGQSSVTSEPVELNAEQVSKLREAIAATGATEQGFCQYARIGCIEDLEPSRFEAAINSLNKKAKEYQAAQQAAQDDQGEVQV